jgi:4a-hydroxytetrahydrobiopterin dehydratase
MARLVTAEDVAATEGLADWRYVLGHLVATYRTGSFGAAADLTARIAAAADAADHHPDVDVRYPDVVRVVLRTHADGAVTDLDVSMARTISALASDGGHRSEPGRGQVTEIAIDAVDVEAVRPFWRAVLDYRDAPDGTLVDPARIGPPVWFQQMDEPRPQRNRIHLDVDVPHDVAEARVAAALAAGGTMITDEFARSWWVLADAEGNEACVCTWQDRTTA